MNVRFLGNPRSPIKAYLEEREGVWDEHAPIDWLVSHGYRHLVTPDILATVPPNHAINCHIGYLPYGRGADPNLWAWVVGEPHGVTIHVISDKYDEGPIIKQYLTPMLEHEHTFRTSYHSLQGMLYAVFPVVWEHIRNGEFDVTPQPSGYYPTRAVQEEVQYFQFLDQGWDTRVTDFLTRVRRTTNDGEGI